MSDSTHAWLPERHLGAAATLSHADELIGQVTELLFSYQTQPEGIVRLREIEAGEVSRTVVASVAPIPRKVSLLVADALVTLRAALEHTLFAEVEHLDSPLEEKAARLIEFPSAYTSEGFADWAKRRSKNGPPSLRIGSELLRRVKGLQPLHRNADPREHPLARLVAHTNHAKHRTPVVTAVGLAAIYRDDERPRSIQDLPSTRNKPLRAGEVIAETPIGSRVPVTLFPTLGINRPGTDRWPLLVEELDEISYWVRTQAVPRLATGSEPPKPALPTRYETGFGHENERRAIAAGTSSSAVDRYRMPLGAASARADLVGTIVLMDGSPSPEQVAAWLASLPDEDLLERFSRISMAQTYELSVMRRNFQILSDMRDEALAFGQESQSTER